MKPVARAVSRISFHSTPLHTVQHFVGWADAGSPTPALRSLSAQKPGADESVAIPRCAFEADAACIVANPNANVAEATPTSAFTDHDDGTVTHIKYLQLPCRWLCAAFAFFVIFAFSEAFAATGPNLITNGNFESGDTGFSSDYSNACPTDIDAGCYKVVIKAQDAHAAWGLPGTNDTFGYSGSGNFWLFTVFLR